MIVGLDVDSVIANLDVEWFGRYNRDYNDNLTHDKVTDWSTHKFVKPECGLKIYDYLKDPTLYDNILPIDGAIETVNQLKKDGHRVIYITTTPIETPGVKFNWLVRHGFLDKKELYNYFEAKDKSLIRAEVLLDDNGDTVKNFKHGYAFCYDSPWNRHYDFGWYRVFSWEDFYNKLNDTIEFYKSEWSANYE